MSSVTKRLANRITRDYGASSSGVTRRLEELGLGERVLAGIVCRGHGV